MKIVWQDSDIVAGTRAKWTNGAELLICEDKERASFSLLDPCTAQIIAVNSADGLAEYLTVKNYRIVEKS